MDTPTSTGPGFTYREARHITLVVQRRFGAQAWVCHREEDPQDRFVVDCIDQNGSYLRMTGPHQ
jgi:hypothetical protein